MGSDFERSEFEPPLYIIIKFGIQMTSEYQIIPVVTESKSI